MTNSPNNYDIVDDSVLVQSMALQLQQWQQKINRGHSRVGWKIGFNVKADQERMGIIHPVVGYLTSESLLKSGNTYSGQAAAKIMVEAEVAILMGKDIAMNASLSEIASAIKGYAAAIEIVDVARTEHKISSILEDNIFHEAVILGELYTDIQKLNTDNIVANVMVNGQIVEIGDSSRYPDDMTDIVSCVMMTLAKQGKTLIAGDWIIAGSITKPFEVKSGDNVKISLSPLGSLDVNINT